MGLIKSLQSKPDRTKKTIIWLGVAATMFLIFVFWIATFNSRIPSTSASDAATGKLQKELPGVWDSFKSQLANLKNIFK